MSIVTKQIVDDSRQGSRGHITYLFIDHLGKEHVQSANWREPTFDADADLIDRASKLEDSLAEKEVLEAVSQAMAGNNPDKAPDHQSQADFDRRVLGRMMLMDDVHAFYAAYPMFQAVEGRGGANANQRAVYLGIDGASYDLIAARFNNVSGVAWFLTDEKNQIWNELPEVFS